MEPSADPARAAPFDPDRDERKSARIAAEHITLDPDAQVVVRFSLAREVLRSTLATQAGADSDQVDTGNPDHAPVFYLDGEPHRRKRGAIARLFTATVVTTRYRGSPASGSSARRRLAGAMCSRPMSCAARWPAATALR